MAYLEIVIFFIFLIVICFSFRDKNGLPTNWPIVGMLPAVLINLHRINDYFAELVAKSNLTFSFKGPWFSNMRILATVDPANVHHIMSKNFNNYPKGAKFYDIFDILGDGIFNTDFNIWQYHRKMAQSYIGDSRFQQFLLKKVGEKIEGGLIPILDHVAMQGLQVDLQDLFERFTFDTICSLIMNYDPMSLSIDFPDVPSSKALDVAEEVILLRHLVPTSVWKFQRWLGVGMEKKHKIAWQVLDDFIYECISRKREEMRDSLSYENKDNEMGVDLMTLYMNEIKSNELVKDDPNKFLRDTILNFFIAGRDTTSTALSWFFYLLSKNPQVVEKIRQELSWIVSQEKTKNYANLIDKLVYLHAALCEALRLYPPVVFEAKSPIESDTLPSGHKIDPDTQIILNMYAMARMKTIWGDDCDQFKPERWISSTTGKIKHEPSYKFLAFNAGPRTCVGKNMAFTQMKAIAIAILQNYHIHGIDGQVIEPDLSIILHMKNGFRVTVSPCNVSI